MPKCVSHLWQTLAPAWQKFKGSSFFWPPGCHSDISSGRQLHLSMHCSTSSQWVGPPSEPSIGQREFLSSPTHLTMPSPDSVAQSQRIWAQPWREIPGLVTEFILKEQSHTCKGDLVDILICLIKSSSGIILLAFCLLRGCITGSGTRGMGVWYIGEGTGLERDGWG